VPRAAIIARWDRPCRSPTQPMTLPLPRQADRAGCSPSSGLLAFTHGPRPGGRPFRSPARENPWQLVVQQTRRIGSAGRCGARAGRPGRRPHRSASPPKTAERNAGGASGPCAPLLTSLHGSSLPSPPDHSTHYPSRSFLPIFADIAGFPFNKIPNCWSFENRHNNATFAINRSVL